MVQLTTRDRGLEQHVRIGSPESGLPRPSWARTEEITPVATERFTEPAHSENVNFFGVITVDVEAELAELDPAGWRPLRPAAGPRICGEQAGIPVQPPLHQPLGR